MYRIMVVDDEDYILKALNRVLATRPDWEVETYTDAATALRRARTTVFDAVITDYRMPDMDGIEMLQELRPVRSSEQMISPQRQLLLSSARR